MYDNRAKELNRKQLILGYVDKSGLGIEIGPSHSPIAPKREGYNVCIIDHLDKDGLKAKYATHGVDSDAIEEVDYIWNGQPYEELVGNPNSYDWIIASHVIEHSPDLIRFLRGCEYLLKDDGVLVLAVPDKRYCFDRFRPLSSLGAVIDCYSEKRNIHSIGSTVDFLLNVVSQGGKIAWAPGEGGRIEFIHKIRDVRESMQPPSVDQQYIDLHSWVFTPSWFRLMVEDLVRLGLIELKEKSFQSNRGSEFFVVLSKCGCGSNLSREELLRSVDSELREF